MRIRPDGVSRARATPRERRCSPIILEAVLLNSLPRSVTVKERVDADSRTPNALPIRDTPECGTAPCRGVRRTAESVVCYDL